MSNLSERFNREVERWRAGASVAWTVLLVPLVLTSFMILAHVSVSLPYNWIIGGLFSTLSPANWTYVIIFATAVGVLASWETKLYTVRPLVLKTRSAQLASILSPSKLLFTVGHGAAASVAAWCYGSLLGDRYTSFTLSCSQNSELKCMNEYHMILVLHGAFTGALFAIKFLWTGSQLVFPIIQQTKYFKVKASFYPLLQSSLSQTLSQLKYFYPVYYLILGCATKSFICRNLQLHKSDDALDTISGLLDIRLFWQLLVSGCLLHVALGVANLLFTLYQTEPFEFALESEVVDDQKYRLSDALDCSRNPLVQYLAYLHLCSLSKHGGTKRQQVFVLSQPGGHPHNWTTVSTQCLTQLKALTESLRGSNDQAYLGPTRQLSGDKPSINNNEAKPDRPGVMTKLKKLKAVAFFLTELPEAATKAIYADCLLYVWAVEALAHLTSASYDEDTYGVVQKSLPDILSTLLNLQEAVEKHQKLVPLTGNRKAGRGSYRNNNEALRSAFRSSLKSTIYRIVTTFKSHLASIPLSAEHSRRLHHFTEYRE